MRAVSDVGRAGITCAVFTRTGCGIAPLVSDDAATVGVGARQHSGMARRGDRICVGIAGIGKPAAPFEKTVEAVRRQLVTVLQNLALW